MSALPDQVDFDFTGSDSEMEMNIDVETITLFDEDIGPDPANPPRTFAPPPHANPKRADVYNLLSNTARYRAPTLPLFGHDRYITPINLRVRVGDFVELRHVNPAPEYNRRGDILCIHYIIEDANTETITLRGLILKRNSDANNLLPKKLNELHLPIHVCEDDHRSAYEQNLVTINIKDVTSKRKVNVTNTQFPSCSFRDHGPYDSSTTYARYTAFTCFELACRWMHVSYYKNKKDLQEQRPRLSVLRTMSEGEAHTQYSVADPVLTASHVHPRPRQEGGTYYTLFDSFCGLGGVSAGASQAGVKPSYAFDHDFAATSTYSLNHLDAMIYTESVEDLLRRAENIRIDILHVSPPCQPFSRPHVHDGRNDEANQAALFSIHTLLKKLRPRIVTLEETEWLVRHHKQWWTSVIHMFTDHDYSITWKIVNCRDYGVSQNRERVILIASCPGTPLPEIPEPTHGVGIGLKRYGTIANTLRDLSRHPNATHNETTGIYAPIARTYATYDANRSTPCITTSGSGGRPGTYHPSGRRDFTFRELACLQGFPPEFEFAAGLNRTQCRRQIGNAVPPPLAKAIFKSVRETLEKEDARIARL